MLIQTDTTAPHMLSRSSAAKAFGILPVYQSQYLYRSTLRYRAVHRAINRGTRTHMAHAGDGSSPEKLFSFGIISDIQWAPIPDGHSFHGTPRYYADAFEKAKRAVEGFKAHDVECVVHLGDIVDYHAKQHGHSDQALADIVACFDELEKPVLHCIGNHCLYNHPRHVLNERLGIDVHKGCSDASHSYFTFRPPGQKHAFIILDGYDVSLLGYPPGHSHHELAKAILDRENPNEEKNSNRGLEGVARRFVKFGGGLSEEQVEWLRQELHTCREREETVIVCCHQCIHPKSCVPTCLLYNYDIVLSVLQEHADVVHATFAGHAHSVGYHCDEYGIHHRVCEAVLETKPGQDCYGIASVYANGMEIQGFGNFISDSYRPPAAEAVTAAIE